MSALDGTNLAEGRSSRKRPPVPRFFETLQNRHDDQILVLGWGGKRDAKVHERRFRRRNTGLAPVQEAWNREPRGTPLGKVKVMEGAARGAPGNTGRGNGLDGCPNP
jgi:hypothetical protein